MIFLKFGYSASKIYVWNMLDIYTISSKSKMALYSLSKNNKFPK